jgi:hypothetical protein
MGERGVGLVLLAVPGCVLGLAAGVAVRAEDALSLPGLFPPLDQAGDGSAGGPTDFLSFLCSLTASNSLPQTDPGLVLPHLVPDPLAIGQATPPQTPTPEGSDGNPWLGWQMGPLAPRKVSTSTRGGWGALTGNVVVADDGSLSARDQSPGQRTWQADQSWRCDVAGPFSAFGQVGANSAEACQTDMKMNARTGLACKVPMAGLAEVVLRGGPGVSCTDPLRPDRTQSHSDWLFEVQARCPLIFGAGLEYQATALPALTPQAQDQLNQDLHLALPVGDAGKFKVGARHKWTSTTTNTQPWTDAVQLYLGLELAR